MLRNYPINLAPTYIQTKVKTMQTITVPLEDWKILNERVDSIFNMLKGKAINKEWLSLEEFMSITDKTRDQVNYICKQYTDMKRKRAGEGIQINYRLYKQRYQA